VKSGVGSLEGVVAKFSGRIAKLPVEFQAIFFEDLTVAIEHCLLVLEKFGLKHVE
jgi:hypothetical protein